MGENNPVSVLASRYASNQMREIFAPEAKIIAERRLWLSVAKAQAKLGYEIPASVIADYEKVLDEVNLESIDAREKITRHDVKARIEEFNALAGHEVIHAGISKRFRFEMDCVWSPRRRWRFLPASVSVQLNMPNSQ
jgi:adenylosuccinate lyase